MQLRIWAIWVYFIRGLPKSTEHQSIAELREQSNRTPRVHRDLEESDQGERQVQAGLHHLQDGLVLASLPGFIGFSNFKDPGPCMLPSTPNFEEGPDDIILRIPRDPSNQVIPTLGPKVYEYYRLWAIWIARECRYETCNQPNSTEFRPAEGFGWMASNDCSTGSRAHNNRLSRSAGSVIPSGLEEKCCFC